MGCLCLHICKKVSSQKVSSQKLAHKNLAHKKLAHKNNDLPIVQDKPHIITSNIEHDSVKLIAEHYENEGLAGIFLINFQNDFVYYFN